MKRGFTLIETVVTVGIVAAMAAVVIPQVARQFDAADPTRVQNDFKNIQTAIETFNVNVKALPADLDDLSNAIALLEDSTITTAATQTTFSSAETGLWQGPYVDVSIADLIDTDRNILTGYGLKIEDSFVCYSSGNDQHGVSDTTSAGANAVNEQTCPAVSGQAFLALQVTGASCVTTAGSTFITINALFDGTETAPMTTGRVRCQLTGGTTATDRDVLYFLAVPIS